MGELLGLARSDGSGGADLQMSAERSTPSGFNGDLLTNEDLRDIVMDGIGGTRRSFARWAVFELCERLELATTKPTYGPDVGLELDDDE